MEIALNLPQHWDDLSQTQLQNICANLHYNELLIDLKHDEEEVNTATFFNISKELLRHNGFKEIRIALKEIQPKAFLPYVQFIFQEACNRTSFPTKVIDGFSGPADRLKNITIAELSFVDALYFRWTQTKSVAYLDRMCATLYRPTRKKILEDGEDERLPFSKLIAENNSAQFADLGLDLKLAIAKAYEGSRNYLVSQYPSVFPKPKKVENPPPNTNHQPPTTKYVPFGELIAEKIQHDPSKLEQVEAMNAYKFLALYELELRKIKKRPKK